jgi:hypothetical protein
MDTTILWFLWQSYILIHYVRPSVCDGSFGGWGKGQGGEAAGDPFHSLDQST